MLRGVLPAAFAIAMGVLVGAVRGGHSLAGPLMLVGAIFILLQVLSPIHQVVSSNLGDRTAAWLYDRLTEACVRPPGIGHLEDTTLTNDLTVARDFDLGMTGPPLAISMDFIANGMVEMIGGVASALILFGYSWWAPFVLGGRGWRRIGCCVKARFGGTAIQTRYAGRSVMPTMLTGWLSIRPPARNCGCSGWPVGRWTVSYYGARGCMSCSMRLLVCANGR